MSEQHCERHDAKWPPGGKCEKCAKPVEFITISIDEYNQLKADAEKWREQVKRTMNVLIHGSSHPEAVESKP